MIGVAICGLEGEEWALIDHVGEEQTECRERKCIRIALHCKREARLAHLDAVRRYAFRTMTDLSRVGALFRLDPRFGFWIHVLRLCIGLIWLPSHLLVTPVLWLSHALHSLFVRVVNGSANAHRRAPLPDHKTLSAIWDMHGARGVVLCDPVDERLPCLERWLDLLYGPGTGQRIAFRCRLEDLRKRQGRLYSAIAAEGGCILFGDAFESVLNVVSHELGDYSLSEEVRARLAALSTSAHEATPAPGIQF